ncbi:hypothetical protein F5B20DRAFT_563269 [Whalleya microplaca]|nr:hypothetical protein F5B20DRAFT_563269 [Whalleya microplaca]
MAELDREIWRCATDSIADMVQTKLENYLQRSEAHIQQIINNVMPFLRQIDEEKAKFEDFKATCTGCLRNALTNDHIHKGTIQETINKLTVLAPTATGNILRASDLLDIKFPQPRSSNHACTVSLDNNNANPADNNRNRSTTNDQNTIPNAKRTIVVDLLDDTTSTGKRRRLLDTDYERSASAPSSVFQFQSNQKDSLLLSMEAPCGNVQKSVEAVEYEDRWTSCQHGKEAYTCTPENMTPERYDQVLSRSPPNDRRVHYAMQHLTPTGSATRSKSPRSLHDEKCIDMIQPYHEFNGVIHPDHAELHRGRCPYGLLQSEGSIQSPRTPYHDTPNVRKRSSTPKQFIAARKSATTPQNILDTRRAGISQEGQEHLLPQS